MSYISYAPIKRLLDILAAVTLLVVLSPLLLLTAILIRRRMGKPVLFRQDRPGLHGKSFRMVKFRTMLNVVEVDGRVLTDRERITSYGRFLRRTSIDELPELWNVLRGDMSIVGPRPLLERYLPYYTVREARRHDVRPGITGLAQTKGRNNISWEDKLALDVDYVENMSLRLDLQIILATAAMVVQRKGVLDAAPQGPLDRYRSEKHDG